MATRSILFLRAQPGHRERVVDAYRTHGLIETAAREVPGFINGELLVDVADPDLLCVTSLWALPGDYRDWLAHPARAAQGDILTPLLAGTPQGWLLEVTRDVSSPPN